METKQQKETLEYFDAFAKDKDKKLQKLMLSVNETIMLSKL